MQIVIDASEPLQNVLRVVGAAYGVELAVTETGGVPADDATSDQRSASKESGRRKGHRAASASASSAKEIRAWAAANGHTVNARGALPRTVVAAYNGAR